MYKPLPKDVTIRASKIHGLGLFAVKRIPKGSILGMTHLNHVDYEDGWLRTPLGGFYNHSDIPNCELIDGHFGFYGEASKLLHTLKDIKSGEELTCTYILWDINKYLEELKSKD